VSRPPALARLSLSLACGEYDRTRALLDGRIKPDGIDLRLVPMSNAFERHARMLRDQAFDVCELSMSSYLMARQRGQALQAIPVFPYRMFRHSYILINRGAGIARAQDLAGKRVGTPMYQTTTALWVRGHMAHEWGVTPDQVTWFTEMPELVGFQAPPGVVIHQVGSGELEPMLVAGDLDALVLIEEIPADLLAEPGVARLFPNYAEVEREFYLRTGIYPMMHALVTKSELLREQPWIAASLRGAFEQAKHIALEQLRYPRTVTLAWASAYREAEIEVFGPDPYVFGVHANRAALEALVTYSHEQGLTSRPFRVDELFVADE
jgi:4,5-dihydroxyphthalate decarboxylase